MKSQMERGEENDGRELRLVATNNQRIINNWKNLGEGKEEK